jgi:hypothetical protein
MAMMIMINTINGVVQSVVVGCEFFCDVVALLELGLDGEGLIGDVETKAFHSAVYPSFHPWQ